MTLDRTATLLEAKQVQMLFAGIGTTVAATLLNITLLSYILWDVSSHEGIILWFVLSSLALTWRVILTYIYRTHPSRFTPEKFRRIFTLAIFFSGITLGSGAFLIVPIDSIAHQTFIYFIAGGMVAGASATLGARFELYALYTLTVMVPFIVKALDMDTDIHRLMGFVLFVFSLFMLAGAKKIFEMIKHGLLLEIDNQDLLTSLKDQIKEKEHAYEVKSQFLANMSHEIRTPINAIIAINTMMQHMPQEPKQKELLYQVGQSSQSLLFLINDILDFSKMEADKLSLEMRPFVLYEMLDKLATLCRYQVGTQETELVFALDPHIPQVLIGDRMRMEQVLLNLLSNAIKFTKNGTVILDVRLAQTQEGYAHVAFDVRDTGIGMHPHQVEKLFSEFFQADSSITRNFGGTGLGLAISKRLVELMGGTIDVKSAFGIGTTFTMVVPLEVSNTLPFVPIKRCRVLLLEPKPATRTSIEAMCHTLSWSCVSCSDEAALQRIPHDEPFDVVLLDVRFSRKSLEEFVSAYEYVLRAATQRIAIGSAQDCEALILYPLDTALPHFHHILAKPLLAQTLYESLLAVPETHVFAHNPIEILLEALRDLGKKAVLIAEDNATNAMIMQLAFETLPFEVKIVSDGAQAVGAVAVREEQFDLIFMDIQMPILNGYDATRQIRALPQGAYVPIVALTANTQESYQDAASQAGMDDYITKPLDMELFYHKLREWLTSTSHKQ